MTRAMALAVMALDAGANVQQRLGASGSTMIYRVDYVLAVFLGGVMAGALLARRTSQIEAARLARGYYTLVALRVVLGSVFFICSVGLPNKQIWSTAGSGTGDFSNFLLGALVGLAVCRSKRLDLLRESAVYSALCLSAALSFMTFGLGKAFHMQEMAEFFTQSGYSTSFLSFIVAAEVLGGAALLIPRTVVPAIVGFSVDMFGAIFTHIHNGDALNDSSDAVAMLVGLGILAFVWALGHGTDIPDSVARKRVIGVAAAAVICVFVAAVGSVILRHNQSSLRVTQRTKNAGTRPLSLEDAHRCVRAT